MENGKPGDFYLIRKSADLRISGSVISDFHKCKSANHMHSANPLMFISPLISRVAMSGPY
jgi:hypothetical protein